MTIIYMLVFLYVVINTIGIIIFAYMKLSYNENLLDLIWKNTYNNMNTFWRIICTILAVLIVPLGVILSLICSFITLITCKKDKTKPDLVIWKVIHNGRIIRIFYKYNEAVLFKKTIPYAFIIRDTLKNYEEEQNEDL